MRQRPGAIEPPRSSLPRVQADDRLVHEAELEQRLDLLGPPQLHRRLRAVGRVRHLVRRPEAVDGCGRRPAPELDDPERRQRPVQARRVELRQPAGLLGELASAREVAAVGGDERQREQARRRCDLVAHVRAVQLPRLQRVPFRQRVVPGPQLDHRQVPERVGRHSLVPLAPVRVEALEEGAGAVEVSGPEEYVRERESHVRHGLRHLAAADELVGLLGELERPGPACVELDQGEPAERRRAQGGVSDLLGQVDRRTARAPPLRRVPPGSGRPG